MNATMRAAKCCHILGRNWITLHGRAPTKLLNIVAHTTHRDREREIERRGQAETGCVTYGQTRNMPLENGSTK